MSEPPGTPGGDAELEILRAIVEGTTDAVFVKDRAGRYLLCNAAGARNIGRPAAEIVGKTDHELFSPATAAVVVALDQRVLTSGQAETSEETLEFLGEGFTMLTTKFPYRGASGEIRGVIGIARDVTTRSESARRIQESERLLRLVLDALPVGVAVMDINGDITLSNAASTRFWGASIRAGVERWQTSRGWWHDTGEPVAPDEWASVRALVEGVPHLAQLIDIEGFDGQRRTICNSAVPVVTENGVRGAVVLNEDITERIRLTSRLAHAQKLEAVGRLAGGVAHDFNNVLMVIVSYTDAIRETLAEDDPRHQDLAEIQSASESASALTRQLLAFGRRDIAVPRLVSVEGALGALQKMLSRVIGENIKITTQLAAVESSVWIDPVQLEQILLNLVVNARDAMPSGGELAIGTRGVHYSDDEARAKGLSHAGDYCEITVRDSGIGMDDGTRSRIFEPFFTTKERGRGTGLGLATVYGIVERNGGSIAVTSQPGHGTTFAVTLPVHVLPATVAKPMATSAAPGGTETILLVEDSPPVRIAVCSMLRKLGYHVDDVASAEAAVAYLDRGGRIDLLITDVVLSGASGRELAETVRARLPATRVLYMSGYPDDDVLRAGQLTDGSRLLAKPFRAEVLARTVREVLDAVT